MATERKFCNHGGYPLEYTTETYTNNDGKEMIRIVVVRGKAYVLYMRNPDTLDGRYDVLHEGGVWEMEHKKFVEVTSDGLSAKEFLNELEDMAAYTMYYKDYFEKR